jgi:hypothetical protein
MHISSTGGKLLAVCEHVDQDCRVFLRQSAPTEPPQVEFFCLPTWGRLQLSNQTIVVECGQCAKSSRVSEKLIHAL